jgi:hypothetical protein
LIYESNYPCITPNQIYSFHALAGAPVGARALMGANDAAKLGLRHRLRLADCFLVRRRHRHCENIGMVER